MVEFTPESLVAAIKQLFELNNYRVDGPVEIHGAEVDFVATPLGDPFGLKVYIEATVEYVDNTKYGKDVSKLAMIASLDPQSRKLIVSSSGFSLPVKERAEKSNVLTLTYDELFRQFEKFDPYVSRHTTTGAASEALQSLVKVYEEPRFDDALGAEVATQFLTEWKNSKSDDKRWIVVTGEYGTGKTALTQVLLYRWLIEYKSNPALPIPFRIELRSFSRQFDARGLLHYFLDNNGLSHIPIEFAERLVRSGRAVMLLDGYDEMAQYFNARERRQCLEALATLSADGAKGLLTSRPNYFTQSEELQVIEVLYTSLRSSAYLNNGAVLYLQREAQVDQLLAKFLDQFERSLRDLTQEQTRSLVSRILKDDPQGLDVVLRLLQRVFRQVEDGTKSLSGKPVIVSYLLQVVDQLKALHVNASEYGELTEWQIYKVIVDQLMFRDLERSSEVLPEQRRRFLQKLAVFLSKRGHDVIGEQDFRDIVQTFFKREINRHSGDARIETASRYFSDLRSSATLTRSVIFTGEGWRFSHNSLREFLVAETLVQSLISEASDPERVGVSDAMRAFAASIDSVIQEQLATSLSTLFRASTTPGWVKGQYLELFWDGFLSKLLAPNSTDPVRALLDRLVIDLRRFAGVELRRIIFSAIDRKSDLKGLSFRSGSLADVRIAGANLIGADFSSAVLDNVDFSGAQLDGASFASGTLFDVNLSDATLSQADFRGVDVDTLCIVAIAMSSNVSVLYEGKYAVGYLKSRGAITDEVSDFFVLYHHPKFDIVRKIIENLAKQTLHQRRGLEQRGAANADVLFARSFIDFLLNKGMVARHRKDLLETTEMGRDVFQKLLVAHTIDERLRPFFV